MEGEEKAFGAHNNSEDLCGGGCIQGSAGCLRAAGRSRKTRRRRGLLRLSETMPGFDALVTRLVEECPVLVIVEASGGFERAVVGALAAAGLPVAVVNPRQARHFARATGRLAKTDALETPKSWHALPKPSSPLPSLCPMKRSVLCKGYSLGADSLWACSLLRTTACTRQANR
jgi:hypothetical protein